MNIVSVDDISSVFSRELMEDEEVRAEALIVQSLELIGMEFARRRRDLDRELESSMWLKAAVKQAVRVMVSQAIHMGDSVGQAGASSTTGPQSDSVTWSQGISIHWGGVGIDEAILELLGLIRVALPQGRGGKVVPYGRDWRWP
ncbi:Gp19/Gp15/Gp42 family protein [Corynebacterium glutamicum]|uniref:Gp19/Gp15/Gp42 family protein n=1 Tax=Corynebacterium glutamicum TaxID=1718 RepID=UPI003C7BE336